MSPNLQADIIAGLLDLPVDAQGESLRDYFCRLHGLVSPRRSRAIFDVLIASGYARNFPAAVEFVRVWLKEWPGAGIELAAADHPSLPAR